MEQENSRLQESCLEFAKVLLAAGAVWKDSTSHSRGDRKIPTSFSTSFGICKVFITCAHRDYSPEWVFYCYELGFQTKSIGKGLTAQEAAAQAVAICREKVTMLCDAFADCA